MFSLLSVTNPKVMGPFFFKFEDVLNPKYKSYAASLCRNALYSTHIYTINV